MQYESTVEDASRRLIVVRLDDKRILYNGIVRCILRSVKSKRSRILAFRSTPFVHDQSVLCILPDWVVVFSWIVIAIAHAVFTAATSFQALFVVDVVLAYNNRISTHARCFIVALLRWRKICIVTNGTLAIRHFASRTRFRRPPCCIAEFKVLQSVRTVRRGRRSADSIKPIVCLSKIVCYVVKTLSGSDTPCRTIHCSVKNVNRNSTARRCSGSNVVRTVDITCRIIV